MELYRENELVLTNEDEEQELFFGENNPDMEQFNEAIKNRVPKDLSVFNKVENEDYTESNQRSAVQFYVFANGIPMVITLEQIKRITLGGIKFRVEGESLEVSYDDGETWVAIGIVKGEDGKTPYIQDGYWYINGVNTNVKAEGVNGKSAYEYAQEGGFTGTEAEFAQKIAKEIPSKVSQLENDSKFLAEVPSEYVTETELNNKGYLTEHQSLADYAKKSELPSKTSQLTNDSGFIKSSEAPVQSVNGKTGAVKLSAADVSARPNTWTPDYSDVGAEKSGAVAAHNTNTEAHNDIRIELKALADRINAVLDSDDTTLDELSEIVAYIKANKALIDGVTTSKVNVSDIINNLTSNVTNKPLSAAQGVALKKLIDAITVPTKVSELENDSKFLTSIPSEYVTETELNNKGYLTEHQSLADYAKKSELPTKTSQLTNDSKFLTSVPSEYVTETELNNKGYLTQGDLQEATNNALAQAKASGEFDGKDGTNGTNGKDGKSAYQYAKDGGYTGTEAEFAEMLANEKIDQIEILLPSYAVATVGVEFNIYHKNVVWSTKPLECYGLKWTISNTNVSMQRLTECLRITPTSDSVGEHTLKLQVKNPVTNAVLAEKQMKLIICERTAVTGKNVVFMGDSLTYSRHGLYVAEIQYNLSSGGIVSVGTQTGTQTTNQIGEVQHEGYNGATCGGFLNANVVSGYANPFYNTSAKSFDFAQFVTTVGKPIHAVCLNLGANNLGNEVQGVADLQTIISKIREYSTDLPIIVSLAPQTAGQDSWRNGVFTATEMRYHWRKLIKAYLTAFDNVADNVYVSTPYFNVDPDNDFPVETVTRCSRDTTQISRQNDSLHPTRIGTLKMADSYYATILYVVAGGYVPEEPEIPVANLVDPSTANDASPDTTTLFKDEWLNGYYLSASTISAKAGCVVTDVFPIKHGQKIKVEGILLSTAEHLNRFRWYLFEADGTRKWTSYINFVNGEVAGDSAGETTYDANTNTATIDTSGLGVGVFGTMAYARFSCYIAGTNEDVKVSVAE